MGRSIRGLLALGLVFQLGACKPKKIVWENTDSDEDSAAVDTAEDTASDTSGYTPCEEVTVDPVGPKHPVVGDVWIVWMSCDDARMVGPMVVAWDPQESVAVDDNSGVFLVPGMVTVSITSGRNSASLEVEVGSGDTGGDTGGDTAS